MTPTIFDEQYKCIPFLAMLYISFALASPILTNKLVTTPIGIVSASVFVSPLWFMLGNVIAEVYGYKLSMKIFWSTMICQFIAGIICHYLVGLTSPPSWHGQAGYDYVLGHFLGTTTFEIVGLILAWRTNAYLLTKWKILLKGKFFWGRSIVSSAIGQIIFALVISPTLFWFITVHTMSDAIKLFFWTVAIRIMLTMAIAIFGSISIYILKRIDQADVYETIDNFNPFRLA